LTNILACLAAAVAVAVISRPVLARENEPITNTGRAMDVAAIYFPGWHTDNHYSAWFGEGWTEWQLLQANAPHFPGQRINRPAWGYFDEADPRWMERQIDAAADHGVSVFLFDWYWYNGVQFLNSPVDEALPKARNRNRLKYALMWANQEWMDFFPVPYKKPSHWLLHIRHSPADFRRVMDFCIRHHFNQPNYWRVDGGAYFSIYQPEDFIHQLGGPEKAKAVLDAARAQVAAAGLGKMHFAGVTGSGESPSLLKQAGFDSVTTYTIGAQPTADDPWKEDYAASVKRQEQYWRDMDTGFLPYAPVATIGWDVTARWEKDAPWPPEIRSYPYTAVNVNNTPERFGELLRKAKDFTQQSKFRAPAVFINSWNEWTEGSALLPGTEYGSGYLDQVKAVFPPREDRRAAR
jgi:hypothetical protein